MWNQSYSQLFTLENTFISLYPTLQSLNQGNALCVWTELFVHQALKYSSNVDCSHWWDTFMAFIFLIFFHTEIVKEQLSRTWLTVSLSFLHTAHQLDLIQFLFFLLSQVKILVAKAHNRKFLVFNGLSKLQISSYHSLSPICSSEHFASYPNFAVKTPFALFQDHFNSSVSFINIALCF